MDINKFWFEPKNPATESEILNVEEILNIKLPNTYRELLKISNGGISRYYKAKMPARSKSGLKYAFFIDGVKGTKELLGNPEIIENWGMPENLVLISGNCHSNTALQYKNKTEYKVVWYEKDCDDEITFISNSFDEFLDMLEPE